MNAFYDIPVYAGYLSGAGHGVAKSNLLDRVMIKLAYKADRGVSDPLPSILSLAEASPSICDVGCGGGAFLIKARSSAAHVVGVDPSPVSRAAVEKLGIEFHAGTAESFPEALRSERFSVITMFQSLEHCRNPEQAVVNAASVLKSDGLFCVDVPNMSCLGFRVYRQAWFHCDAGRHLQFFTPQSLASICEAAGLRVVRTEYAGFTGQFTPAWIKAMQECWDSMFGSEADAPPRPFQDQIRTLPVSRTYWL